MTELCLLNLKQTKTTWLLYRHNTDRHANFWLQSWRSKRRPWTTRRSNGECEEKWQLNILGDWNAVVGEVQEGDAVGKYGLRDRNNRGQRLIDYYKGKELIITNTIFQQHPRRRYTWLKPGNTTRYQIYYTMIKRSIKYTYKKQNVHGSW